MLSIITLDALLLYIIDENSAGTYSNTLPVTFCCQCISNISMVLDKSVLYSCLLSIIRFLIAI